MSDFQYEPEPARGCFDEVAPGIRRMVAANASQMTYHGTNTYLIEAREGLYVIDPGPADDERHFVAIVSALAYRGVGIVVTHHHSGHFGSVERLKRETGLRTYAAANFADGRRRTTDLGPIAPPV